MDRHPVLPYVAVGLLLALAPALALAQWDPTGRLGLSASATTYIDTIEPTLGEPFTLHVILTGLAVDEPLGFELAAVEWVIHTICCGDSPVGVTDLVHAPGFVTDGEARAYKLGDVVDREVVDDTIAGAHLAITY